MPNRLSIVIRTYNRLNSIKRCLESLYTGTHEDVDIIVLDGGSSDGTLDYLLADTTIRTVEESALLGPAMSLNNVFRTLETEYVCWLSDENALMDGMLDEALAILEAEEKVGLLALKVKDADGPFTEKPYVSEIWPCGVLSVQQAMLPTAVVREVGYLDEDCCDECMEADLVTKVLAAGYQVAYTKKVALLNHGNHGVEGAAAVSSGRERENERTAMICGGKNLHLKDEGRSQGLFDRLSGRVAEVFKRYDCYRKRKGLSPAAIGRYNELDVDNVLNCCYISILDSIRYRKKNHYLVQQVSPNAHSSLSARDDLSGRAIPRPNRRGPQNPPVWKKLLEREGPFWEATLSGTSEGPSILVVPSHGLNRAIQSTESLLAVGLTLRGAKVSVALCDGSLPACLMSHIDSIPEAEFGTQGPKRLCHDCFSPAARAYETLQLELLCYSRFISRGARLLASQMAQELPYEELCGYTTDGVAVGEHAMAGALRYFARGTLEEEPHGEMVLRRFFHASLLTTFAMRNMIKEIGPSTAVFNHGIYVPQGLVGECCRRQGVRVVNWNPSYRKKTFVFSHGDTYHHTLLTEPVTNWENLEWNHARETRILDYLNSRRLGSQDWIWFHERPEERLDAIVSKLGINPTKPTIVMLTNVMWDAQLHYRSNAFSDMLQWTLETIKYFENRLDLQLVIRVHPAEIRGTLRSRQPLVQEINRAYPDLASNVHVIGPESRISTYAVIELANAVIVYGTKTGVEITSMGIPVIVGGEAWIRNKGLTFDASSPAEYFRILDSLPYSEKLSAEITERARKYAYHFFFRRMIPVACVEPDKDELLRLNIQSFRDIVPGADPGLDAICDGIMAGSEFIFKAEQYER